MVRKLSMLVTFLAALAVTGCGGSRGPQSSIRFAPYADVTLASSQLARILRGSGARDVVLSFVLARSHRCDASWGGELPIGDPAIRAATGTVLPAISFGGRDGPELAQVCLTAGALAAQYERVIDRFHAVRADFDLESGTAGDTQAIARRSLAMDLLQRAHGNHLTISLTVPADQSGLTPQAFAVIRSALRAGVRVQLVNVLAMDYGGPIPAGTMGRAAISTATSAERQLRDLLPGWARIGITTMIGHNDSASEVFTAADAAQVVQFAGRHHLGAVSFWSLGRDRSCPAGVDTSSAQDTCSGVRQAPFEFTRLFSGS